ncbi:uncharacterized protein LOC133325026 [Musca vetustissima]|uniref:uncharacterized protein LOC133325026 n=1 Tax=Musca vetustissima TaxID=27455 RepID=UPI002AB73FF3|nr:uncharacterized protein LOC133325026 [Musca vetustissima]
MGFRLLILMAMGLGAMYMLHLLAQDWDKIRQPVPAAVSRLLSGASRSYLLRGKRDIHGDAIGHHRHVRRIPEKHLARKTNATVNVIDWKRILSRDPFECLQSLVCQLLSGAEKNSEEAVLICDFLEENISVAPSKIGRAFSRGLAYRGRTERCYDEYPFCWYSAKTMLKMLKWLAETVENDTS